MSLALHPMSVVQMLEPRTKIYSERKYALLRGGSQSTWKPNISTSYSNSSIQFTAPPPNPNIMVDRKVMLNINFLVTLLGDAGAGNLLFQAGTSSPRARPIQRILTTSNATLNNTQISVNSNDIIEFILRYWDPQERREIHDSLSPSMLDQSQNYSDVAGGIRDPLRPYASSVSGADTTRGGFNFTVLTNTQTSATILLDVTDFLFLPPFLSDVEDSAAFIQIQTMDFNFTLGDLSRVWSVNNNTASGGGGVNITSVSAVIKSDTVTLPAPQLLFNYITPSQIMAIPKSVVYPYYEIQRYPSPIGLLAPNATQTVQSNNIQLHSIPNRMYIGARRRNQDQTAFTTDTFAGITNISVNWNNKNGLLSAATPKDLHKLSVANGLELSWSQFSKFVGSPLCIVFGKDIMLDANECPGLLGTYQLQLNVTVQNLNQTQSVNYDLYIITISEGALTIEDNRSITQIGVMSQNDVLRSLDAPMVDYNQLMKISGGSFWSNVKNFFLDAGKGIKKAYDTVAPIVKDVLPVVRDAKAMLGFGAYSGGGRNSYTDFLKKNKEQGISLEESRKMWREQHPDAGKAKKVKKAKKEVKKAKRCPVGKRKKCVAKGGIVYEGGELIDREEMMRY